MQIAPGVDAGVVRIVEHKAHGVIADRFDPADADILLSADSLLLRRAMAFARQPVSPFPSAS
jgi:hypothetical protein